MLQITRRPVAAQSGKSAISLCHGNRSSVIGHRYAEGTVKMESVAGGMQALGSEIDRRLHLDRMDGAISLDGEIDFGMAAGIGPIIPIIRRELLRDGCGGWGWSAGGSRLGECRRWAARQRRMMTVCGIGEYHRRVADGQRMFMGLCILDCWCLAARLARAGQ